MSDFILFALCWCTRLLVVAHVGPSGIAGKYPGRFLRFKSDPIRIKYTYGRMTNPSKPLTPLHRSLWKDPAFVLNLKWYLCMSLYSCSTSNLVRKVISNEVLVFVALVIVMVLNAHLFWYSLGSCVNALRKWIQGFMIKHFGGAELMCSCWN